jgi:hypothetical protein
LQCEPKHRHNDRGVNRGQIFFKTVKTALTFSDYRSPALVNDCCVVLSGGEDGAASDER